MCIIIKIMIVMISVCASSCINKSYLTFINANQMSRKQTFTGLDAFGPRVRKLGIPVIATLIEPSTATSATTESVR